MSKLLVIGALLISVFLLFGCCGALSPSTNAPSTGNNAKEKQSAPVAPRDEYEAVIRQYLDKANYGSIEENLHNIDSQIALSAGERKEALEASQDYELSVKRIYDNYPIYRIIENYSMEYKILDSESIPNGKIFRIRRKDTHLVRYDALGTDANRVVAPYVNESISYYYVERTDSGIKVTRKATPLKDSPEPIASEQRRTNEQLIQNFTSEFKKMHMVYENDRNGYGTLGHTMTKADELLLFPKNVEKIDCGLGGYFGGSDMVYAVYLEVNNPTTEKQSDMFTAVILDDKQQQHTPTICWRLASDDNYKQYDSYSGIYGGVKKSGWLFFKDFNEEADNHTLQISFGTTAPTYTIVDGRMVIEEGKEKLAKYRFRKEDIAIDQPSN